MLFLVAGLTSPRLVRYEGSQHASEAGVEMQSKNPEGEEAMEYYHGTTTELKLGAILLPPEESGVLSEQGRRKNLDRVFFTKDAGYARIYAGRACQRFGGQPVVYRVTPLGEVECLSDRAGATVYSAASAKIF